MGIGSLFVAGQVYEFTTFYREGLALFEAVGDQGGIVQSVEQLAEVARFTAQRYRFPGVEIKARLFRNYPYGELASHVLGYIGRINQAEKAAMDEWSEEDYANYRGTEVIGKLGIEQRYERELHGITGVEEVETSAGGRPVRRLRSEPSSAGSTVAVMGVSPWPNSW